jgi:hypothetical protein
MNIREAKRLRHRVFVRTQEGKRPLEICRRRLEKCIKINFREI